MNKADKPKPKWRWLKRGLFAVVALITLLAVVVVVENLRGRHAWAKYKGELEAAGEPLRFDQLVPTDIPDDQNFAKTPLLAPLSDYEPGPTGELVFADPEAKRRLDGLFGWTQVVDGLGSWRDVRATDWAEVQTSLRSQTNSQFAELDALLARPAGTPADDLLFLFSLNKVELDEISAAVQRPYSVFRTRYDQVQPGLMPQLLTIRVLARGFALKPRAELVATNAAQALADWKTCIRLGNALDGDPVLISLLVKLAVVETSLNTVWEGLGQRRWNEPQLAELQRTLESMDLVADARRYYQGERAFAVSMLDQMLHPQARGSQSGHGFLGPVVLPGWIARNKIAICRVYTDFMLPMLDSGNIPVHSDDIAAMEAEIMSEFLGYHPYHAMVKPMLPSIGKTVSKIRHAEVAVDLATVACALERYRLAEGHYPENLGGLQSRFLKALSNDVDGQPLHYRLEPDGSFALYSVGTDLKDDGGSPTPSSPGDWVWRYPAGEDR